MNRERAALVLERHGLEGLIVGDPLNVYHALGHWPQIARTRVGQPPTTFALIPRDPAQPVALVTSRFLHYYTWADAARVTPTPTWLYADAGDAVSGVPSNEPELCADRGLAALSPIEQRRRAALVAVPEARRRLADAGAAIVQAMRELGFWHGAVGVDHPVLEAVCARHDRPGRVVAADNILREIRLVKSPLEIALLRRAAQANVAATRAVAASARAGAHYSELRQRYALEAAQRGNSAVFLTIDRVSSDLADEAVRDGQMLFLDAVSHFRHYHGDFARTVFIGEPPAAARRAAAAAELAWGAVREHLRPGLRYSEIVQIGTDALKAAGHDTLVGFGPHSVGLMHTDEPGVDAQGFYRKADLVLEPNMVLSVDCPVMDTGIGGSAHIEDLMLITPHGAEPLHELAAAVIQV